MKKAKKNFLAKQKNNEKKKRFSEKKIIKGLDLILANLRLASYENKQVIVPVKVENLPVSCRIINQVIEYLERQNLISVAEGKQNQFNSIARTIKPTDKLIAQFEHYQIKLMLNKNVPFVELRNSKKEKISILRKHEKQRDKVNIPVSEYNQYWLENQVTLNGLPVMPFCRRIYSNNSFDLGGRYYGRYQQLPKLDRQKLLINEERVAEPDYSGLHINLIYAQAGLQFSGNAYSVGKYKESTIKAVMLRLLNSDGLSQLIGQINKSASGIVPKLFNEYQEAFALSEREGLPKPNKPACLNGFIENIPAGTDGKTLLNAIMHKHRKVKHLLGSKDIGLRLQNIDSKIISDVLQELVKLGIPALPVHDSMIVPDSDRQLVVNIMKRSYRANTGFDIEVK